MSRSVFILGAMLLLPLAAPLAAADCPLPRSPVLLPTAMPDGLDCLYDEDGNGLDDSIENGIASCVSPEFRFDVGEPWWSLGPEEPHVIYNMFVDSVSGEDLHVTIRYGTIWAYDGGFATSGGACDDTNEHAGDTQGVAVGAWVRHAEAGWSVEFEVINVNSQGENLWLTPYTDPPIELSAQGHPVLYPSTGKHHWYVAPGEYDFDTWCGENAYGNLPPRVSQVEHVANNIDTAPQRVLPCGDIPCYFWCNACDQRKGLGCVLADRSLRRVDLFDWRFPDCHFTEDGCEDQDSELGLWYYIAYPGYMKITDPYFMSEEVSGVWQTVLGGYLEDVDGDGIPFWVDTCPVHAPNGPDEDGDGLGAACDPEPAQPNVYVAGGAPGYPALTHGPLAGYLDRPPVCDAAGESRLQCAGPNTQVSLSGAGSSDPDPGDSLAYEWTSSCPGATFDDAHSPTPTLTVDASGTCLLDCSAKLQVTDSGDQSASCSTAMRIRDSAGPDIACPSNVTVACDSATDPLHTGAAAATDACDPGPLTIEFSDDVPADYCAGSYMFTRTWSATDGCDNASSCDQTVTLVDSMAPVIACNSAAAITPPNAPISFTATAADNCDPAPQLVITGYDCYAFSSKGRRIDKTGSCIVAIDGTTVTILDSGGVGDHITWTARATDCAGNVSTATCVLEVIHP